MVFPQYLKQARPLKLTLSQILTPTTFEFELYLILEGKNISYFPAEIPAETLLKIIENYPKEILQYNEKIFSANVQEDPGRDHNTMGIVTRAEISYDTTVINSKTKLELFRDICHGKQRCTSRQALQTILARGHAMDHLILGFECRYRALNLILGGQAKRI